MRSTIFGRVELIPYNEIADALSICNHLLLRCLVQDALREQPMLAHWPRPATDDATDLALLAGIVDLLASHRNQPPPGWTATVEPLAEPRHLMKSVATMRNLRHLCETESPEPLRRMGFYAPPNFLQFA